MIFTQNPDAVFSDLLKQVNGLVETASLLITVCEVMACGECVRMIFTQNPGLVFNTLFVEDLC